LYEVNAQNMVLRVKTACEYEMNLIVGHVTALLQASIRYSSAVQLLCICSNACMTHVVVQVEMLLHQRLTQSCICGTRLPVYLSTVAQPTTLFLLSTSSSTPVGTSL